MILIVKQLWNGRDTNFWQQLMIYLTNTEK